MLADVFTVAVAVAVHGHLKSKEGGSTLNARFQETLPSLLGGPNPQQTNRLEAAALALSRAFTLFSRREVVNS